MNILQYILGNVWHFLGTLILLWVLVPWGRGRISLLTVEYKPSRTLETEPEVVTK